MPTMLTTRLESDLYGDVRRVAAKNGLTVSELVRDALVRVVLADNDDEREARVKQALLWERAAARRAQADDRRRARKRAFKGL